ncbi:MAG: class 1 fructose-bisphosphatase [Nitrospirae bacterium]|nr:class 1 fructose-bisphosphatase [Candidatus Manganitrophaceae bacterium]
MELGTTLTRFLIEQQRKHYPKATGDFTGLLAEIATTAKILSREVNKAGLIDILGYQGRENVHGERVQKLDDFANETFIKTLSHTGHLIGFASEELEGIYQIPDPHPKGKYVLVFDPLDGSSNIDVNISIGSIFSIHRRKSGGNEATMDDFLQPGRDQVGAGYIIYGSSTMMVYSTGYGVHGFTLDPSIGEFLLSHEDIKIPSRGKIYSINDGNAPLWENGMKRYIEGMKKSGATARYVGSLVADFHRNLLKGGIFLYPGDSRNPHGKLRLLYEAAPLAFIVEQAQGRATTGTQPILDIKPESLHQKVPLIIGSAEDVKEAESFCRGK